MRHEPENVRRDWRIPDELWERIQPLLPPRKSHPLGCHRPRVDDRRAMDAIFFVLAPGANGTPCRTRASVPVARRTAASKSGRQPGFSWPSGNKAWLCTRPCRALTGNGWPWTGR